MKVNLRKFFRTKQLLPGIIVLLVGIGPAWGIVLHPGGEPNLATWTDRPDVNVVGAWSNNASFVVIAPNWIITTRHQNSYPSTVTINGVTYNCTYNNAWIGGPTSTPPGNADIRLIRLTTVGGKGANLPHYASPYTSTNETGKDIVIGGYGEGRGASLITQGIVYGYLWDGSANTTQRWCQNIVNYTDIATGSGYTSYGIVADFNDPASGRPYEGAIALYDSGGGWFIHNGTEWQVAGLSHGVEHSGESLFRDSNDPNILAPDGMDAVRISYYTSWISGIIHTSGDLNGDDWVDFSDYAILARNWQRSDCNAQNNWCEGADFSPHNGHVDWSDLGFLADNWLTGWAL